jgi:sugar lactone lactonase YvrE
MNESLVDALARTLTVNPSSRRGLMQGLAGAAAAVGFASFALGDTDARKRKKKRKKKGKGKGGDGDGGGGCNQTLCEGQCVNLDSDENNCGACGEVCPGDTICVGGLCAFENGSQGDGDTQFDEPAGMGVSAEGFLLVADTKNTRVQRLTSGTFNGSFGEFGEDDGQFLRPIGVAGNPNTGDIYVTDVNLHRVQKFDTAGTFLATTGTFGSGERSFNAPLGLAIDRVTDQLFVADTNNDRIARYSENLFFFDVFGATGGGNGQFREPSGLVIDRQRNVVVADTGNNRIQVVDQEGRFVRAFGRQGNGNGEFNRPVALALDEAGDIFVVDQGNNRVQQFTADGQFTKAFGRQGNGVGEFNNPFGIAFDSLGLLTVVDTDNHRVQHFFPASLSAESVELRRQIGRNGANAKTRTSAAKGEKDGKGAKNRKQG